MFQGKNPKKNFYEICPTFSVISITIITHLLSFFVLFFMANWEMFCCKYNLYQLECKKFFNYWNATHLWCSESFSQPYFMYVICLWTLYKVKKIDFYSVHNIKTYLLRKPCFDLHIKQFPCCLHKNFFTITMSLLEATAKTKTNHFFSLSLIDS